MLVMPREAGLMKRAASPLTPSHLLYDVPSDVLLPLNIGLGCVCVCVSLLGGDYFAARQDYGPLIVVQSLVLLGRE